MHAIITRQHKLTDHLQYDLTAETAQIINQNPLALRIKKIKVCHFVGFTEFVFLQKVLQKSYQCHYLKSLQFLRASLLQEG